MSNLPIIQQSLVETPAPQPVLNQAQTVPLTPQPSPEAKLPDRLAFVEGDLGDGRKFKTFRAKGRHMQNALRVTDKPTEQSMVMAASVTEIDGTPLVYEDFLDLDFADCSKIISAFNQLVGN